jgi:hypothetical protein
VDKRDILIYLKLVEHRWNGGTGAREIHKELRGEIPLANIQRRLNAMKLEHIAAQTGRRKWITTEEGLLSEETHESILNLLESEFRGFEPSKN